MGDRCGTIGKACPDVSSFPICDPSDQNDAWTGLKRLTILHKVPGSAAPGDNVAALLKSDAPLPEKHSNPTLAEANDMLTRGFLQGNGFAGICRSPSITGEMPDKWYTFQGHPGKAGKVVLFNDYNPAVNGAMFRVPIELSKAEAFGLVNGLGLRELDIACEPGACVKDGSAAKGKYYFTADPTRLAWLLMQLADPTVTIPGLAQERREAIIAELFPLKEKADQPTLLVRKQIELGDKQEEFLEAQQAFADRQEKSMYAQIIISVLLLAAIGYQPAKDLIAKIKGRVKTTDFGKYVEGLIKADPEYDVKGRAAEARAMWMMTDTTGYRHIIIDAPTGEGKDKVAEEMLILKARGDGSVPPGFQNAKVVKINAAEFQANTQFRGNVADKVAEIAAMARKGKVVVYISEIDLIFLSGGSSSGDSEAVGKLLLDLVEDPAIKENLILLGTTSRGSEMLARYPDLQRRFNWPRIHSFSLAEVADVLLGPTTKTMTRAFGATFDQPVVEAAAKLAEALYRPSTLKANPQTGVATMLPRIDAVKTILEDAAKIARAQKSTAVTVDHVIAAVQGRCGQSFEPVHIEALLQMDIDQVRVDSYMRVVQEAAETPAPADAGRGASAPPEAKEAEPTPDAREEAPAPEAKESAAKPAAAEVSSSANQTKVYDSPLDGSEAEACRVDAPEAGTGAAPEPPPLVDPPAVGGRNTDPGQVDLVLRQLLAKPETAPALRGLSQAAQRHIAQDVVSQWMEMSPGMRAIIATRESPITVIAMGEGNTPMPIKLAAEIAREKTSGARSLRNEGVAKTEKGREENAERPEMHEGRRFEGLKPGGGAR